LQENQGYWAVVTSLPLDPLKVYIQGDLTEGTGIVLAKRALEEANSGQKSLYVKQVENSTDADFNLLVENGQYWITQDERPVVAPIPERPGYTENGAKEAIQALEAIARWTNILELKSSKSSKLNGDVEMEIIKYGYEDREGNITPCEDESSDNLPLNTSEHCLKYKYKNGEWKRPVIKVKLTNKSRKNYFAVFCYYQMTIR